MLRALLICLTLLGTTARSQAQTEAPQPQIEATIEAQIEAMRADDWDRAFTYASPTIHQMFGTAQSFSQMVQTGYPMVWHPAEVQMMDLRMIGGALWQRVRITDQQGQAYLVDYQMVKGPDGWLINAVQLQKANDIGA